MSKVKMMKKLEELLPTAIADAKEEGYIDNLYGYEISGDTVQVQSSNSDDVLISICLYTPRADDEVRLVLVGIDNDGTVDLIKTASADEDGLDDLIKHMNKIEEDGIYEDAVEWEIF